MKRILFLGICAGLSMSIGCGDDAVAAPDGGSSDGGLHSGLDKLGDGLGTLGSSLDDIENRINDLENPPDPGAPGSCSLGGDVCIPDGLDITKTGLVSLVEALCENMISCCEENELFLNFGPGITDLDTCVASFESFVERGIPPGFVAQAAVNNVVLLAQALNSPGRQGTASIALNKDGIDTCAAQIADTKCTPFVAIGDFCDPFEAPPANACALTKVVDGLLDSGEPCNLGLTAAGVPQCADDFTCRNDGNGNGICARSPVKEDACTVDGDCASVGGTLYCNQTTGQCEEPVGKGDDCSYADPSLAFSQNTAVRCEGVLVCDPKTKKCVEPCSIGYSCFTNANCPENKVCDLTTYPAAGGFCRDAFANDATCTGDAECKSGFCDVLGSGECAPARKAFGKDCAAADDFDATCISNYCGPDSKCTKVCVTTDECPDTHACIAGDCVPRLENAATCTFTRDCVEESWCDGACNAKLANTGDCTVGQNDACESGYCASNVCTATLGLDGDCGVGGTPACGPDAYCFLDLDATPQNQCKAFQDEGDSCAGGKLCDASLECDNNADTPKCFPEGEHPNGAGCGGGGDCLSGNCVGGECMAPADKGDDCDSLGAMHPPCDADLYCKTADATTTVGTCASRRIAGQSCLPRYGIAGGDCLNGAACTEVHGGFYCNAGAVETGTASCDGT